MKDVLLLNLDDTPLGVIDWRRAVLLVLEDRVRRVVDYDGLMIRSASLTLPWPAVVGLRHYASRGWRSVPMTRGSVLARDRFTCQYCGRRAAPRDARTGQAVLTVDHVVPRARAREGQVRLPDGRTVGLHAWENLVTACKSCNLRKGASTPEAVGLSLRALPRRPGPVDALRIVFARVQVEEEWQPYLPEDTGVPLIRAAG